MKRRGWILGLLALAVCFAWQFRTPSIPGDVQHDGQPLADVEVRARGAASSVRTGNDGRFELGVAAGTLLAAAKTGFLIEARPAHRGMRFHLQKFPGSDDPHYAWQDAQQCAGCHGAVFDAWKTSGHARAATNPRFLDLIEPKNDRPTWNMKREHPEGIDVCAKCHVPTLAPKDFDFHPRHAQGVAAQGVHCDLCHKAADVTADKLGTRFGIDALDLRRPSGDKALFFGPLADAVRAGESFGYAPVYKESRYCAACHEGTLFGTRVYQTFSEWQASPAAARGQTCQTCHLAPTGKIANVAPAHGGIDRPDISDHAMIGLTPAKLRACLEVKTHVAREGDGWRLTVTLRAHDVGHRVPTGFIDRHLVLMVEGRDAHGNETFALEGAKLHNLGGEPWAGKAGKFFGRIRLDPLGKGPIPFWLPAEREVDTRLLPDRPQVVASRWPLSTATVRVRLIYRRTWPAVALADNEIDSFDNVVTLSP